MFSFNQGDSGSIPGKRILLLYLWDFLFTICFAFILDNHWYHKFRCRPAVRISGFHPGDPGSIPGNGIFPFLFMGFFINDLIIF